MSLEQDIETINKSLKEVGDQIKAQAERAEKEIQQHQQLSTETRAKVDELLIKQGELVQQHADLSGRLAQAEQVVAELRADGRREPAPQESVGQIVARQLKEEGISSSFRGKTRVSMPRSAITSIDTNSKSIVGPDHRPGIIPLPLRRPTIRDLVAPGTTESNNVQYVQETGFTNNAAPVSENPPGGKPYSDLSFELKNAPVQTIAHLFKASRQILDDLSAMASFIDARARTGLMLAEELQLLYGNGTGINLHGMVPQADQYSGISGVTVDAEQRIDRIRLAILQSQLAEFPATGIVLNPIDWAQIELTKDGEKRYIVGNAQQGTTKTLWGLPVVDTQAIAQDEFLVGAFALGAQIFDRMEIEVLVSTENDKDFEKNMVTIRAEERLAFAVYRPEAFVTGQLGAS